MKSFHAGMGVVVCEDVLDIDQDFLHNYMSALKSSRDNTFTYIEEEGVIYAINATGFKFDAEGVSLAPHRFMNTRNAETLSAITLKANTFIDNLEDAISRALVEYCRYFPDAATTAWWRPLGHIAGYGKNQRIGPHCDDQVPYEWGKIPVNQVSMHNSTSINLYLNDCVLSIDELNGYNYIGGQIHFPTIPFTWQPKAGSIVAYPSNYIGRHEVLPVQEGDRYAYLTMACYGTSLASEEYVGQENSQRIWMPNLIEDSRRPPKEL